jgi:hypothetical protein
VIAETFEVVGHDDSQCKGYLRRDAYANARLIASAPELLEDAKKLVNEISGVMGAYEFRELIGNTNFAVLQERWEQMRATIAKAEEHS